MAKARYYEKLTGERCYLSPLDPDDAERFAAMLNDPDVAAGIGRMRQIVGVEREREILTELKDRPYTFAIVECDSDALMGSCAIGEVDHLNQTGELGIMIGERRFWDQGIGQEAVGLLLGFAFRTLNLHVVTLQVFAFNARAIRCYEKCGFREAGRIPEAHFHDGERHDVLSMALLRRDYESAAG